MRIFRLFVLLLCVWVSTSALAGLVWTGVAVDPAVVPRLKMDERFLEQTLENAPDDRSVYLDKAWHGIHFLLSGSAEATKTLASKVIFGGESFGPDQAYGRAQLLTSAEVKAIAKLLTKLTPELISARYNPQALEKAEIYPSIIWVREGPEALKYVLQFYKPLVEFYQRAAERGNAVIFVVH
jgi:hypothetical protein